MKKISLTLLILLLALTAAACGSKNESTASKASGTASEKKKIEYLDKTYEVTVPTDKIAITGSVESMEDAKLLDVHPQGAISFSGKFPDMFKDITDKAEPTGEKMEPNIEKILEMKPDVILASTKFPEKTLQKISTAGTTIPVSHISSNWKENMMLLAQLTGKEKKAKKIIADYEQDLKETKTKINEKAKDSKALVIRIRQGNIYIYPEQVYFNSTLYGDLGLKAPDEVKAAKAQELISLEKLSEMNPDHIFVQFSDDENADKPDALKDLEKNPIWKSLKAVKEDHVYVNSVDPLAQGGTAWSKVRFLKAATEKLTQN
ncbi:MULTISPECIES: iron ABC transporter substrate-binding protein FeuA [unclassified Bacillus (in: firmicutes)]|uniref:iron ABC transporter substrate-binding protein FeuA n=1 Tax=unclassified Bacillus (in: firmicutes) TaxID=185979 RepID=UPI002280C486|nr:iron ABC transporter substrate-binding protein FeuA [Bacillus sp. S20C3]MCY8202076.1 iron ABC transporter substrate-binding protein FeuA [Bacillus sp. N12A5]MCY8287443.1 iron ABC transporter substrate-binding protein FeuA [Bacillus sp. N13C7]MCY8638727.1 iron ABC transporter substrate-binding protein FeuA [Bacillus sp. S17B2]MCY8718772.1 iron ABC transporter substrate-binding protein FeuA [Bacillus sp. S10C12M]MCY9144560.1 iron ABC transporter substrate-binding protein FeuA [Bacillus sp. T9